jgi:ankyrin repeat protein
LQVNTDFDKFGNTTLHMCVIHDQADMTDFLACYCVIACKQCIATAFTTVCCILCLCCLQVNTDCDEFGNTALHMCVIHDQADMYDFLVDYCAASEAVRNHGGLTPLCLAAQTGKSDMLQHVYNRRRRAFYSFGKVRRAMQ